MVAILVAIVVVCIIGCMCWICIVQCGDSIGDEYEIEDEGEVKNPL